ncbi:CYTH domain-containing protein [Geomonas silvestris]|uniref:CYTH domain-containing protein n=1 Tax=Geomonas silvestris TaxID=2740184 RepID=A0A6V8MG02_9BACT|nr:CYTH domain-containing protein [Geomonas silvestris]GFO58824.1 CYTH domain-containing protein [Geomonas silvestris]
MAQEIERKFLVKDDSWRGAANQGTAYRQGYLSTERGRVVRVRVKGPQAVLTIKGERIGISAPEFEYPIPVADAEELLADLCLHPLIEKVRYEVAHAGLTWEIDVFSGDNEGLVLAEVELESEDQEVELPGWAGPEVSDDRRYSNASLVSSPYRSWK